MGIQWGNIYPEAETENFLYFLGSKIVMSCEVNKLELLSSEMIKYDTQVVCPHYAPFPGGPMDLGYLTQYSTDLSIFCIMSRYGLENIYVN